MENLFYQLALSHTAILRQYLKGKLTDLSLIKRLTFVGSQNINPDLPDYIHKNNQKVSIDKSETISGLLFDSYEYLTSNYLHFIKNMVYVKADTFESWQKTLTWLTPLPIISFAIYKEWFGRDCDNSAVCNIISLNLGKSTLPSIYHPFLTELIKTEGLNELHLHLNGTTEVDRVWQDALCSPSELYMNIKSSEENEAVREQYLQLDDYIDESKLYRMLNIARVLRDLMTRHMFKQKPIERSNLIKIINSERLYTDNYLILGNYHTHPINSIFPFMAKKGDLEKEALFLIYAFSHLKKRKKGRGLFAHSMYCYLLILSYFNKLLVQQITHSGFDQFQKITFNELREISEKEYDNRYKQLESMYGKDLTFLEGRFSPKDTSSKNYKLLKRIIGSFKEYQHNHKNRIVLKLIAHFIKRKETRQFYLCRHYLLRRDNSERTRSLLTLWNKIPEIRMYVTAIDAAANELHTPPEVYAPVFRAFRRKGFTDFTYHVGEDYVHLISGIRAVYEAVTFLELSRKNRVGHATAVGIEPGVWKRKSGRKIIVEKGEWLDDLVFAYMILSEKADFIQLQNKVKDEIFSLHRDIYDDNRAIDIHLLIRAWRLRSIDPLIALDNTAKEHDKLDRKEREEWRLKEKAEKNSQPYELFKSYHSKKVVGNYKKLIPVKTDFFGNSAIAFLQKKTIELLNERGVAIESMPTSNVRISYYDDYQDHHLFRWLNIGGKSDLPEPIVCLCSDDPGIFATNLRNEFAHIYQTLVESYNMGHTDALTILKQLNENARAYRFVN
ncbi:MAG: hypothetical protein GY749_35195 [Desulfobacteraceae bacterium]|nr:hypothetical protein [Desulfobacteraceae bacterium]